MFGSLSKEDDILPPPARPAQKNTRDPDLSNVPFPSDPPSVDSSDSVPGPEESFPENDDPEILAPPPGAPKRSHARAARTNRPQPSRGARRFDPSCPIARIPGSPFLHYKRHQPPPEFTPECPESCYLSLYIVSDTHGKHRRLTPDQFSTHGVDALLFAGDMIDKRMWRRKPESDTKWKQELLDFNSWCGEIVSSGIAKRVIVVGGNHDRKLDDMTIRAVQRDILTHCTYLMDSQVFLDVSEKTDVWEEYRTTPKRRRRGHGTHGRGVKIWGSPYTRAHNMAFGMRRSNLAARWVGAIPRDTDILLTHMPPHCILDLGWKSRGGPPGPCPECGERHSSHGHWGCKGLRRVVEDLYLNERLRIHAFGHNHDEFGVMLHQENRNGFRYVNGSMPMPGAIRKPILLYLQVGGPKHEQGDKEG